MTEHRLAHILRAIADGKVVQYQTPTGGAWTDFNPDIHSLPLNSNHLIWRIKPKPIVKKWKWLIDLNPKGTQHLHITSAYFSSKEKVLERAMYCKVLQRLEETLIEEEED